MTSHGFFVMYYGPEFTAASVRQWLARTGVKTLFIKPGSPWENGYLRSFNGKLRDECLNGEVFETLDGTAGLEINFLDIFQHITG